MLLNSINRLITILIKKIYYKINNIIIKEINIKIHRLFNRLKGFNKIKIFKILIQDRIIILTLQNKYKFLIKMLTNSNLIVDKTNFNNNIIELLKQYSLNQKNL